MSAPPAHPRRHTPRPRWHPLRKLREHFNAGGKPKLRFESLDAAEAYIAEHQQDTCAPLCAYACSLCAGFHLAKVREA